MTVDPRSLDCLLVLIEMLLRPALLLTLDGRGLVLVVMDVIKVPGLF